MHHVIVSKSDTDRMNYELLTVYKYLKRVSRPLVAVSCHYKNSQHASFSKVIEAQTLMFFFKLSILFLKI